ncbi:MAG TPA: thiamine phosphate synthase [Thermomicrobiales bacterium]|nr:thiamine phosphate synthase [Thermomicrobiales bacterium]
MIRHDALRLYLVASPDNRPDDNLVGVVSSTIAAGVTCLQLRWKSATDRAIFELGRSLLTVTRGAGIPLIINDRLDVALALGADGVHLGVDDLPIADARRLAGPDFIIGYSPETDEEISQAAAYASYLGIGPFFSTATKPDAGSALGPVEFARRRARTTLPTVAIGGISSHNAAEPLSAGADGIAVVSAILGMSDPAAATRDLVRALPPRAT